MKLDAEPIILEGNRVRLLPMEENHIEPLFAAKQHPLLLNTPYIEPFRSIDDARKDVNAALAGQAAGITLPFVIEDKNSGEIVGTTRLHEISPVHHSLEIGWTWLHPDVWRSRVNTECKYLLLRYSFESLDMIRVQIKTDLRNERSQRAIERLGAVREGVLRKHRVLHDGYVRDTVMFSIISDEWPAVKEKLEAFLAAD